MKTEGFLVKRDEFKVELNRVAHTLNAAILASKDAAPGSTHEIQVQRASAGFSAVIDAVENLCGASISWDIEPLEGYALAEAGVKAIRIYWTPWDYKHGKVDSFFVQDTFGEPYFPGEGNI